MRTFFVFEVLSTLICIFIVKVCLFLSWLNIETQLKEMKYNCLWKWNETTVLLILWYGDRKQPQETFYLFAFYCWFKVFAKSTGIHFIILTIKSKFYLIEKYLIILNESLYVLKYRFTYNLVKYQVYHEDYFTNIDS